MHENLKLNLNCDKKQLRKSVDVLDVENCESVFSFQMSLLTFLVSALFCTDKNCIPSPEN